MKKVTSLLLTILIAGAAMKTMRTVAHEQRNRKAIEALQQRRVRPRPRRVRVPHADRPTSGAQGRFDAQQRRR